MKTWQRTFPRLDKDHIISQPKYPNPENHKIISFIKSGVRIIGYACLGISIPVAIGILVFSEVIGVIEEMV